jgi:putative phage-type endonuclease
MCVFCGNNTMGNKLIWTEEELRQGSPEWLEWRKGGDGMTLGGSEVAPLMYMSPWATPLEVFKWKTGLEEKQFSDAAKEAMAHGELLEPVARKHYANKFTQNIRSLCAIHPEFKWMRTSLDGITEDNRVILEIKCPRSRDNHVKQTRSGRVPTYRFPQLQWQIAVMREHFPIERVDYVSFWQDETMTDMVVIPIHPDEELIAELIRRGKRFVEQHLRTGIEPPPTIFLEDLPLIGRYPKPKIEGYWQPGMALAF